LVNSRYPLVSATPFCSGREVHHIPRAHLLPKLRCHFAEFLKQGSLKRLGILSPPTCVGLRYGHHSDWLYRSFSRKHGITEFVGASALLITSRSLEPSFVALGLLTAPPTGLNRKIRQSGSATLLRPSCRNHPCWCRNINLLPIAYAFRPRLRDRLTLGRLT
jgi:hypothetical protein